MKNAKMFIITLILLVIVAAGYFGLHAYNKMSEEKKLADSIIEETENAEQTVFSIELDDVVAFGFTNANGEELHFEKTADGWKLENQPDIKLNQDMIGGYALSFTGVTTVDYIMDANIKDFGLDKPTGVFYVNTAAEKYTITYGNYNSVTGEYYFMIDDDPSIIYYTAGGLMGYMNSITLDGIKVTE